MVISIRDVPAYERHLLFCTNFGRCRRRQHHRHRKIHAINRSLAVCGEAVAPGGLIPVPVTHPNAGQLAGVA